MSIIRADSLKDRSGAGAPSAPNGMNVTGVCTATTFSGSGASLTSLPAAQLSGTAAAINGSNITNLTAGNLTGTLPAIDGSNLTGISVGMSTTSAQISGITTVVDLSKDDIRLDVTGSVTIDTKGGTEGNNHVIRIENVGVATVSFSSYFKFPSGGTPNLPTTSGAISLISFTIHRQGRVGVDSTFLAGSSVNFS